MGFCYRLRLCKIASLRDIPKIAGSLNNSSSNNKASSLRLAKPQRSLKRVGLCSQIATGGQHSSPIVFPEKCDKVKASKRSTDAIGEDAQDPAKVLGDIEGGGGRGGDEKSDLLGYVVFSGKLVLDERKTTLNNTSNSEQICDITNQEAVDATLTSKALVWGSHVLPFDDFVSVSYNIGLRHFTVHAYPLRKASCGFFGFIKSCRTRKDFCFVASSTEEAIQWVRGFADQQCYVNCLPHPSISSKKQASSELLRTDSPPELLFRCKTPPKMLVILNPCSGRGHSNKIFHGFVEPIFKLAGFRLEVVETTYAGHARKIASSVDASTCPDGIICVGGDGIINEVLNGLLSRDNQKEGISIPIGIIPTGSDNSLVWTVLGVRDPVSAAMAIVKGSLTATDVFAVEWTQTGKIHFGLTVSYYGFVSDVLELSQKYQKCFGPLRYFVAGFLKFLCLPKYSYEVEYLPALKDEREGNLSIEGEVVDMSDLYTDIMRRSNTDGIPKPSILSSIDSIMTPSCMSGGDLDTCSSTHALSSGRNNVTAEPEVIHPQLPLLITPNWPRMRSESRTDKGWPGLSNTHDTSRCSWGDNTTNDKEDIASTLSDPGPTWDVEPIRDVDVENPIELPGPSNEIETETKKAVPGYEEKWVVSKGQLLGILVCNHSCRTIQSSQVVAPKAEPNDNTLDLILVHGSGRLRLLIFFLLLQMGQHLSLPYVEYIKVKSVRIKPGKHAHNGCGIDGELFPLNGQVISSLLPEQCRLIGHFNGSHHR